MGLPSGQPVLESTVVPEYVSIDNWIALLTFMAAWIPLDSEIAHIEE